MSGVRAFDPYARAKRHHPSAQPALEPDEIEGSDATLAKVLPFRRPEITDDLDRAVEAR